MVSKQSMLRLLERPVDTKLTGNLSPKTLFNPLGTVVKLFLLHYDLVDMPPNSQTFLRQRTVFLTGSEQQAERSSPSRQVPNHVNGRPLVANQRSSQRCQSQRSRIRYLIQFK